DDWKILIAPKEGFDRVRAASPHHRSGNGSRGFECHDSVTPTSESKRLAASTCGSDKHRSRRRRKELDYRPLFEREKLGAKAWSVRSINSLAGVGKVVVDVVESIRRASQDAPRAQAIEKPIASVNHYG